MSTAWLPDERGIDHAERMNIAALIERMANPSEPEFSASDARSVFDALADLPVQTFQTSIALNESDDEDGATSANGAPLGGGGEGLSASFGTDRSYRCGALVVTRHNQHELRIRRVAHVDAEDNKGEILSLRRRGRGFDLRLNDPWILDIGILRVVIGMRYRQWKRAIA